MFYQCKMCGGTLDIKNNDTVGICEYCGTKQTLPRLDNEKKANLYDRAAHFRQNNDYDAARVLYEQVLAEDKTDAEAYWSIVLCRYGIEYVEDPATHKRIPTVNRTQYTSIFNDPDYQSAIQYADPFQSEIYEQEAKAIDDIQKGILKISKNEKPFDIFICYKESDENGRRTIDSVLAYDVYKELVGAGYKVFFSRVTLEDKIGTAYEPYIFAALNSAPIMLVIGTKKENFNAVWVKNEWSRFLGMIKSGAKKTLIPMYKDMNPYDLPVEFAHLQAQDMNNLGYMQDLLRGLKKLITSDNKTVNAIIENKSTNDDAERIGKLMSRADIALDNHQWKEADGYFEQILEIDPKNAFAYVGKLMSELKVSELDELMQYDFDIENNNQFKNAMRFADGELKRQLNNVRNAINNSRYIKKEANKKIIKTVSIIVGSIFAAVAVIAGIIFCVKVAIPNSKYKKALGLLEAQEYEKGREEFSKIEYKDSEEMMEECERQILKDKFRKLNVGDTVQFGNGMKSGTEEEGIIFDEELKQWRVLEKDDEKVLLIQVNSIGKRSYNDSRPGKPWDGCTLRKWLNSEYLENNFTEREIEIIKDTEVKAEKNKKYGTEKGADTIDKIWILSVDETEKHFEIGEEKLDAWYADSCWLRTPGATSWYTTIMLRTDKETSWLTSALEGDAIIRDDGIDCTGAVGVIPVMYIDITSFRKDMKGETMEIGDIKAASTPTPVITATETNNPTPIPTQNSQAKEWAISSKIHMNTSKTDDVTFLNEIKYGAKEIYAHSRVKDGPADSKLSTYAIWETPYGSDTTNGIEVEVGHYIINRYSTNDNTPLKRGTYKVTVYNGKSDEKLGVGTINIK